MLTRGRQGSTEKWQGALKPKKMMRGRERPSVMEEAES